MRQANFEIAIHGVPAYYAVFQVLSIPKEIKLAQLKVGDLMYWNYHRHTMVRISNSMGMLVTSEHLRFVTYMTAGEMKKATRD